MDQRTLLMTATLAVGIGAAPTALAQAPSPGEPAVPEPPPAASSRPPPAAAAGPYVVRGTTLEVRAPNGGTRNVALGCRGTAIEAHGARVYVGCGDQGVVVVDVSSPARPGVVGRVDMGGEVRGFFVVDGQVWAEIARREARPVREAQALAVPSSAARPAPSGQPSPSPTGKVIESEPGEVVVTVGSAQGVRPGDRVEMFERRSQRVGDQVVAREETVAVGEVTEVTGDRARVALGFGEHVAEGTAARPTGQRPTRNMVAPPRQGNLLQLAVFVRPFVPLGDLGFGMLGEVSITYRGESNWFVGGFADALGFGVGRGDDVAVFSGNVLVGYDHPIFEVGLGVGGMRVNEPAGYDTEPQTALSLAQTARFGALDGLHLAVTNTFVLLSEPKLGPSGLDGTEKQFEWGTIHAEGQIPVATPGWIVLRGGGGRTGHGFVEAGLRWAVRGNGGRGSLFLTPTVGGVWTFGADTPNRAGPSIGLGVEYRP